MSRLRSLSSGMKFCEYPPNCLQFKALCLAYYEDFNLPSASAAYRDIKSSAYLGMSQIWSHKVVKFTACRLPPDFLKIEADVDAFPIFKKAYEQVCNLVKQGHILPELPEIQAPVMLSHRKPADPAIARHYLDLIKHHLGART